MAWSRPALAPQVVLLNCDVHVQPSEAKLAVYAIDMQQTQTWVMLIESLRKQHYNSIVHVFAQSPV